ncbi:MAG TPA: RNA polymerase sigma factor [Terriglobia bacterium]|nr:RNA polymerase sigma factor [Terriglobia bacterium]
MERVQEDAVLAAKASRGDADAFCALIRSHHRSMYLLSLRFCGNHHDAEDLVQEVFLKAYRGIGGFHGASSFKTWLTRIMVNTFLNFKRGNRPETAGRIGDVDVADMPAAGAAEADPLRGVMARQILDRLAEIPPRQRLMFLMRHEQGFTTDEIARSLGTTAGTVKKTIHRVVERLRGEFVSGLRGAARPRGERDEANEQEEGHARLPEVP